jgi:aspartyl-tRNA(Asn)/glutamyl-tRNA(Gln) amidotransferase subunit B
MPELPDATRARLQHAYNLSSRDVDVLMSVDAGRDVRFDGEMGGGAVAYFEEVCAPKALSRDPKAVVNWWVLWSCASR